MNRLLNVWPRKRHRVSASRRSLGIMLIEGIPASILGHLIGGPLQVVYLTYLGFSAFYIGIVLAIPSFALLIQIVIAIAMQHWRNRRPLLVLFGVAHRLIWVCTGLVPLLFPPALWVPVYISLWLMVTLTLQSSSVIWTSLIADAVPRQIRGKYFGLRNMVSWGVVCLTLLIGGQIMERLPQEQGFVVIFAISAVCVVWNGWALAKYPNPAFEPSKERSSFRMLRRPFADRRFLAAALFVSLFIFVQLMVVPLFAYIMLEIIGMSAGRVTMIVMLQNVVMMVSYYCWGLLNGRYATNKLLRWTFPLIALACFVWIGMPLVPAMLIIIVTHIILGVGLSGYNQLIFNFLIGDTPQSERPVYIAVFSAFTGLAGFSGTFIGGWMFETAKTASPWVQNYGLVASAGGILLILALGVAPFVFKDRRGADRRKA